MSWRVAVAAGVELGERPVWDAAADALIWVETLAGRLHRWRPGARDEIVVDLDVSIGAAAPRTGEGYVLAAGDGFRLVDGSGRPQAATLRPPGMDESVRFNDGACDPAGRFWAGTTARDGRPNAGALYRLDADGSVALILDGIGESNGIGWSPDGATCYYVDSAEAPGRIRAFRFDAISGRLGVSRELAVVDPRDGVPDGLVVDEEGCVWVALWGGGAVRRYAPTGELLAALPVPVSQPSCPGFGGADLSALYLTSAWEGMDAGRRRAEPSAGDLFVTEPGVRGLPAHRYEG